MLLQRYQFSVDRHGLGLDFTVIVIGMAVQSSSP